jgi:glycerol-3-phosphate dehydrogenase (NAD(P)+)
MKVCIYGLGQFGYALLKHLDAHNGGRYQLHGFARNKVLLDHLQTNRCHLFFHKDIEISQNVFFDSDVFEFATDADIIILAVKSDAIREVVTQIKPVLKDKVIILNTAKALAEDGQLISRIIADVMTGHAYHYAILAGGTIASDLFLHEPLGADIAADTLSIATDLCQLLQSGNLSVYPTTDVIGVEYAAAFKNVISILSGIVKGMGFSYGSQTHTISRTAYEVERLVTGELGGQPETFFMNSQCWGNDMWMSCTGDTRNRQFGVLLGSGHTVEDALAVMTRQYKEVEGIKTVQVLSHFKSLQHYPFLNFIYQFVCQSDQLDHLKELLLTTRKSR